MKTTLDYLQAITTTDPEKIKNDNQLAIRLGVTRQAISQYRKGQSMSVGVALKVARLLQIDPTGPVLSTMYHQAGTEEERAFWLECYRTWATE
jgi:transcriptional regulator with XRE-family HTH domain